MERVVFLSETTGVRLGCMLNPDRLVIRRLAGIRPARSIGGLSAGVGLRDDPLLFTGGGTTELTLDLLFDVTIAGSSVVSEDVRDLTRPLSELAEQSSSSGPFGRMPQIRFLWGKAWNIPAVVVALAERFEHFTRSGVPRRSWLRLRLLRTDDPTLEGAPTTDELTITSSEPADPLNQGLSSESGPVTHLAVGGTLQDRPDWLAAWFLGDSSKWRSICEASGIDDPLRVPAGTALQIRPEASP